jgi:DNA-binding LacI/PurR family transcriptional regulator
MRKKITIKDVAKVTGISKSTISRVVNNFNNVNNETRLKVLKAIDDLGYQTNYFARGLRKNKSDMIGIIIGNVLNPFYSTISKAVEETASKYGYNVVLCNSGSEPEKELKYLKILQEEQVDGIIFSPSGQNKKIINKLLHEQNKIVVIDRKIEGIECDSVTIDNIKSSYEAVSFLINQGFKRIGIICVPLAIRTGKERLDGYIKALKENKIDIDEELIKKGDLSMNSGIEFTGELLKLENPPQAIFVCNLDMTTGALQKLKKENYKIPQDISLLGFDDAEWTPLLEPPLTTVSQPVYSIGSMATELLIKRINGDTINEGVINMIHNTTIILRKSVKISNIKAIENVNYIKIDNK